ncbi:diguanylate cyclase [Deinococcus sp. VB343]|uniref:Diguanylate cyclase n=1 Tax=Deinococcus sp. VB142 TaxID=3112952 RepID=A0AAU6Q6I8_9DEIO
MLVQLVLNFCVLVTLMYLLSLSYRNLHDLSGQAMNLPRALLLSAMAVGLMLYPAEVAPGVIIDMRAVPIAYLALRRGVVAGLLGAVPVMVYRFHLGGVGVWAAMFSAVGVALVGGWLGRSVDLFAPRLNWRSLWWKLLLVFVPNGLLLPVVRHDLSVLWMVYLPLLLMCHSGFVIGLGILRSRFRLLQLVALYAKQAHEDTLSALPNRRQFDQDAAAMDAADLLCLVDIDHFKKINDHYGHAAGDEVLAQLGQVLRTHLRARDQAYRYGGEEFAVIFRAPGSAVPEMLGERLRKVVHQTEFKAVPGHTLTVSVGIAYRGTGRLIRIPLNSCTVGTTPPVHPYRGIRIFSYSFQSD